MREEFGQACGPPVLLPIITALGNKDLGKLGAPDGRAFERPLCGGGTAFARLRRIPADRDEFFMKQRLTWFLG